MTGPEERTEDRTGGAAGGDAWTSRRVPSALGAVSDAVLDALGDVIAMAASEARRDAETRLATALEELDAARREAEECRLRIEEMARERAILEEEIGSGMASMEASMKRIRSALVKAAVTPGGDATERPLRKRRRLPGKRAGNRARTSAPRSRQSRMRTRLPPMTEPRIRLRTRYMRRKPPDRSKRRVGRAAVRRRSPDRRRLGSARGRRRHRSHRPER